MPADASFVDPWTRTINLLSWPTGSPFSIEESVDYATRAPCVDGNARQCEPVVRIIDRPTALTVTLDWGDATKCCYREQLWMAARARISGRCAMSGAAIAPGDEIFRPRPARPAPRNVNSMILASAVEAFVASEPTVGSAH